MDQQAATAAWDERLESQDELVLMQRHMCLNVVLFSWLRTCVGRIAEQNRAITAL
jgi:hypothetical protein